MPINWQEIIATFVATVGGGGVLLAAAAWLIKAVVTNRLALDAEKFKIEMKASADIEIERVKAFLTRGSRVHERQLDILAKLYRHFYDAQGNLRKMTSAGHMVGDKSTEEYAGLVNKTMAAAHEELANGRLFIPSELAQQCDSFFVAAFDVGHEFAFAHLPMVDPVQSANSWKTAATVAHKEVPKILQQIEKAARTVIHGE
jgi:hypothetical protein